MKKFLILSMLILFTNSAYAGSCPMIVKNLDSKIEEIHYVDAGYNKVGMPDPKNIS